MTMSRSTRKPSGIGSGEEIEKRMKNTLKIVKLKTSPDLLKEYDDAIVRHQKRYNVSKPSKWNEHIQLLTNMRYISEEQWDQTAPIMSFDILKHNYIYDHLDEWLAEHIPDKAGHRYHTELTWYNIYENEGNQLPHYHVKNHGVDENNTDLVCSGVCYIRVDETINRKFHIYDGSPWKNRKVEGKPTNVYFPQAGDLYLFPPDLWHEAVQTGIGKSIVIAFNVFFIE